MKAQLIGAAVIHTGQILRRIAMNAGPGWLGKKYFIFPAAFACEMMTGHFNQLQQRIGIPDSLRFGVTLCCAAIAGEVMEEIIQAIVGKTREATKPLFCKLAALVCILHGGIISDTNFSTPNMSSHSKIQIAREMSPPGAGRKISEDKKIRIIFPEPPGR